MQRVHIVRFGSVHFRKGRNSLHSDRISRIVRIHQGSVVRCDTYTEAAHNFFDVFFFFFSQIYNLRDFFNR